MLDPEDMMEGKIQEVISSQHDGGIPEGVFMAMEMS